MGQPANYSLELPQRCLQLLDGLWRHAQDIYRVEQPDLGPLTSTLLISMSMPIINLPIERIGLVAKGELQPYVDDRHVNATAAAAIITTLEKQRLRDADFFVDGRWSFACRREGPFPNIAECFPEDVAAELGSKMAQRNAADMPVSQWCSVLRNALAHGGVAYLNAQGQSYPQGRVKMYAFVSGKHDKDSRERPKPLTVVNYLRISEDGYRDFLQRWVDWL